MSHHLRRFLVCLVTSLLVLTGTSCSKQARSERALAKADTYYASGAFDNAEVEYLNTLKLDPRNARAHAQLGLLYSEQGRIGSAPRFLNAARELAPDNLEVRAKFAVFLLTAKRFDDARTDALYLLEHQPDHAEAPLLLAESAQTPQAIEAARTILQKLPTAKTAPVLTALAGLEFHQRRLPEAEALLKQAVSLDPKSAAANVSLGTLCLARNDPKAAEEYFSAAWANSSPRSPRKLIYVRFKLQTGDVAAARRLLTELTSQAPDCLAPMLGLAEIAAREKQYDEALALVDRILSRDSSHYPAMAIQARLLLAKGKPDQALAILKKLEKLQPKNPEIQYQSALCHLAQNNMEQALGSLNQAIAFAPGYADAILLLADINLRKGEAKAASASLKTLVTQQPNLIPAKFLLARAYVSQGQIDEALTTFKEISAGAPDDPNYLLPIAIIYRQQKKFDEARKTLSKILERSPDFGPAIEQLTDLDLISGDLASARTRIENLMAKQPALVAAHLLIAKVCLAEKKTAQAEAALLKAIELQPETTPAYYMLASIYIQDHQEQKALDQLQQLAGKTPNDPALHMRIAVLQERLKNYPAARDAYEKILAIKPNFVLALNNLAYLYGNQFNQAERGLPLAQKARGLAPLDASVADTLGWILYQQGQFKQARTLFQESANKSSEDATVQFHLGMARYMMGETEGARSALSRALQLNADLPEKNLAQLRLAVLASDDQAAGKDQRAFLEKTVAEQPNDPVALTQLGIKLEKAGEFEDAQKKLKAALAINPLMAKASLGLMRIHLAKNEIKPALELAKTARQQMPDDPLISHQLGRIVFATGDYQWAASLLQESAQKLPDQPEVLWDRAKAAYSIGRVDEAGDIMRRLKQSYPLIPAAQEIGSYLDMITLAAKPTSEGSAKINQILQADPAFVPALFALGAQAEQQSDSSSARQAYEKVLAKYPDFTPAKRQLALLAASAEGFDPKTYALAQQAREAFPHDPDVALALGILSYRKGDFDRAASLLKENILQQGENARNIYHLGMAQYRLKDKAAKATLLRSLDLGLKDEAAKEVRQIVQEIR